MTQQGCRDPELCVQATVAVLVAITVAGSTGCQSCRELGGGAGLDLPGFDVVYECSAIDGTERVLELCFDGDATELGEALTDEPGGMWTCEPTPRHLGPCLHSCPPPERGCNALAGCYCPPPQGTSEHPGAWSGVVWMRLLRLPVPDVELCETVLLQPATGCRKGYKPHFDGCRWGCIRTAGAM